MQDFALEIQETGLEKRAYHYQNFEDSNCGIDLELEMSSLGM